MPGPLQAAPPSGLRPCARSAYAARSTRGVIVTRGSAAAPVPFQAHLELIRNFLAQRPRLVQSIQGLLNAQQKPAAWRQDKVLLTQRFEDAFFDPQVCGSEGGALRGQLQAMHWSQGFTPREMPGMHND